jgi:hypothetical protein
MNKLMEINILGHPYKMQEIASGGKEESRIKADEMGKANLLEGTIFIDKDLASDAKGETLQHEVIECINFWGNLDLNHHQITLLSVLLYDAWSKNPHLVKYILGSLKRNK